MSGTTWKKKSRHGFPVLRNVPDEFSVWIKVGKVANPDTIWSIKGSLGVVLVTVGAGAVWVRVAVGSAV